MKKRKALKAIYIYSQILEYQRLKQERTNENEQSKKELQKQM